MSLKLSAEILSRKDVLGFNPADLIANFAPFTGRIERDPITIEAMAVSLLADGQIQPITFRKGHGDIPIPVSGHTRILAAHLINTEGRGNHSPTEPFVIYGTYRPMDALEAVVATFRENDDDTRTPTNPMDKALLVRVLSENFGKSDAEIATMLRKSSTWVAEHQSLLELDPTTKHMIQEGVLGVTAANVVAQVAPAHRSAVIAKASQNGTSKPTARAVANAARETGAVTSGPLKRTHSDLMAWVTDSQDRYNAGPRQAFLFALTDYMDGTIGEDELTAKFVALKEPKI